MLQVWSGSPHLPVVHAKPASTTEVRAPAPQRPLNINTRPQGRAARVNHLNADEAQEAPEVVLGTLPVNCIDAKVLFDTGASHSFVSVRFSDIHGLPLEPLPKNLMLISPGASMTTSKISHGNEILIGGHLFLASLIALGSSDIDVILGMDWLKGNKAKIDYASKMVTLSHPSSQIVYSPKSTPSAQLFALNVDPLQAIQAVPVVCDFPDVFPDELPGMPPDRAVEFVIELEPGTALVSKRPYKMGPPELVELKK